MKRSLNGPRSKASGLVAIAWLLGGVLLMFSWQSDAWPPDTTGWTGETAGDITLNFALRSAPTDAKALVDALSFERYKDAIRALSGLGDRAEGTPGNRKALDWAEAQLQALGYAVARHRYFFRGQPRDNLYVTKIGRSAPHRMYIVSAHIDGRGGGGAADDDGSGAALVMEVARALSPANVVSESSVRFVFWNNEETGLNGSDAYVRDRRSLQGIEDPLGSGQYPEPIWLGVIQHDMLLYDHGLPPRPEQIAGTDIDIEYQRSSRFALQSLELASALSMGSTRYSTDYPSEVSDNMRFTDSASFQDLVPSVSVRENRRVAEIGNGSNPHYHQPSDRFETYSDDDFRLGFNALQMTLGAVAELVNVSIVSE